MKKPTKSIITSSLLAVAFGALSVGSTFALFTSQSKTEINVGSGIVNVESKATLVNYSSTVDGTDHDFEGTETSYSNNKIGNSFSVNGENSIVTIDKMVPGDSLTISLSALNKSNVKTKTRLAVEHSKVGTQKDLFPALKFTFSAAVEPADLFRWQENEAVSEASMATGVALYGNSGIEVTIAFPDGDNGEILFGDANHDNQYQDAACSIAFSIQAVQGNAATSPIDEINAYLSSEMLFEGQNKTMHDAVIDMAEINYKDLAVLNGYVYDLANDRFVKESSVTANKVDYFKVCSSMPNPQDFSIYAAGNGWTTVEGLTVGFDAGDTSGITSIVYDRHDAAEGQTVVIRTNGGTLTVNAPLDSVKHYGDADSVNIVAMASESYHENGKVPFIQISQGRIELEATADVNGIHVANVQTVAEDGTITKTENTFSNDVVLTLNGNDIKLTRDTIGTAIESPVLVCEVQENANSNEFIWLVGDGTIENAKVYVTETNETPNTAVPSTTNIDNASDAAIAIANNVTNTGTEENPVYEAVEAGTSAEDAQVASALKGAGTEENPFLVYDYETMQKISDFYDLGYYYFEVDLAKTDNGKIDCTGWIPVKLHGSFNGNGVEFTNVTACLFQIVGYQLQNENILLEDFDATMNVSSNGQYGAAALVKNIFNAGVTTFDNVNVHGYLEGFWNMGSFYNYGTANYDDHGCNYEVVFNDCYSDATLVCGSGNTCGGFAGHTYEGAGNQFIMRINNSSYVGTIFTTTGKAGAYIAMSSNHGASGENGNYIYVDGERVEFNDGNNMSAYYYSNTMAIAKVTPVKGENGYTVAKQSNVSRIEVTITAQLTAYDSNNVKITNLSGITMTLSSRNIEELDGNEILVLDTFNAVNLVKNAAKYDAYISDGTLNVAIASSANYQSGNIRLQVNQYDSAGLIVSAGTIDLVTSADANAEWIIK